MRAVLLGASLAVMLLAMMSLLSSCKSAESYGADILRVRVDNLDGMAERQTKMAEMREFLWDHWRQRQRGALLLTTVSKEGGVSHSEFRIALIPPSTMVLKVTVVRDRIDYLGNAVPKADLNGGYEAYTMERIATDSPYQDWKTKATVLADDTTVSSSKYWLRFKDREGYPITYF
jgi:hypothetical protein